MLSPVIESVMLVIPYYALTLTIILALILDAVLGEAKRFHYLVGFGNIALFIETRLNPQSRNNKQKQITINAKKKLNKDTSLGFVAWLLLVLPLPTMLYFLFTDLTWYWQVIFDGIILYLAIGLNSLNKHAMQVYKPLQAGNLDNARHFTGYLVSRDTTELTPNEMARATTESMLENGHDSVIASIIYYLIGGAPLAILHRLANTLDAMWGYKNSRYYSFGYTSARLDDLLGFITGKVCTVLYALQALFKEQFTQAIKNAYQQGNRYKSHNGGWVMAAGATVMNIKLGGTANYHGKQIKSVSLGQGNAVTIDDIPKSIKIVRRATAWLLLITFVSQSVMYAAN